MDSEIYFVRVHYYCETMGEELEEKLIIVGASFAEVMEKVEGCYGEDLCRVCLEPITFEEDNGVISVEDIMRYIDEK